MDKEDFVQNRYTGRVGVIMRLAQDGRWVVEYTDPDSELGILIEREEESDLRNLEEGK